MNSKREAADVRRLKSDFSRRHEPPHVGCYDWTRA